MPKDVVTLLAQFDADEQLDIVQRQHRDRGIGRELNSLSNKPSQQIRAWLTQVASSDVNRSGEQMQNASRLISIFSILLGLLVGVSTTLAVFYYDGSRPVNVINVLAVFIFLQALLLVSFIIACLPRSALKVIPGLTTLQDTLQVLNPGKLVSFISRYLPQNKRHALRQLISDSGTRQRTFATLTKWMILRWSQYFALAFNVSAILCALYLVVFSDLAFGWSTTLKTDSGSFHGLTQWLTMPWQTGFADATPSLELVDNTRYYRLDEGLLPNTRTDSDPALLGQWWPFLLMCILVYGLVPRVVTTMYTSWRIKSATNRVLVSIPESVDLLERLNSPDVETAAIEPETDSRSKTENIDTQTLVEITGRDCAIVDWASAIQHRLSATQVSELCGVEVLAEFFAGGKNTLADDQKVIEQIHNLNKNSPVIIFVKAWEPPMLELVDFINDLQNTDTPQKCIVIPVAFDDANQIAAPTKAHLESWHQALYALVAQRVSVHSLHKPNE
ncbi:MAG: DUF2868 domain-containing protein [Gammaproteobacteria bacterium]|nr:DUF2868 domain-containing protein [Gammaproteobacteria bacterium]